MSKNVATGRATRREFTKFSLTHQQVMELSVRRIPVPGGAGKRAKHVERPAEQGDKAYRVVDSREGRLLGDIVVDGVQAESLAASCWV